MIPEHSDEAAPTAFSKQAIDIKGLPKKVAMDKSDANYTGLDWKILI
jgi:hypothetical protein